MSEQKKQKFLETMDIVNYRLEFDSGRYYFDQLQSLFWVILKLGSFLKICIWTNTNRKKSVWPRKSLEQIGTINNLQINIHLV